MPGAQDDKNQPGAGDDPSKTGGNNEDPNKGKGGAGGDDDPEAGQDDLDYGDAEKVKAEIAKLRKENAKHRHAKKEAYQAKTDAETKLAAAKKLLGVEGDDESLEDKIKARDQRIAELEMETHLRNIESDLEIPKEHGEYFRFLLSKEFEKLKEGEELADEVLEGIVEKVKTLGGGKGKQQQSTGLDSGGKPNADEGKGTLSVEQFVKMSVGEKSQLYVKNPQEYNRLFSAAREKKLL